MKTRRARGPCGPHPPLLAPHQEWLSRWSRYRPRLHDRWYLHQLPAPVGDQPEPAERAGLGHGLLHRDPRGLLQRKILPGS